MPCDASLHHGHATDHRGGSWGNRTFSFTAEALPTGELIGISPGDQIRCTFSFQTNRLGVGNSTVAKEVLDKLFQWSCEASSSSTTGDQTCLGSAYTGQWSEDARTLVITLIDLTGQDVSGYETGVGTFTLTTKEGSALAAWDNTTMPGGRVAVLNGSWGARDGPTIDNCTARDTGKNSGYGDVSSHTLRPTPTHTSLPPGLGHCFD